MSSDGGLGEQLLQQQIHQHLDYDSIDDTNANKDVQDALYEAYHDEEEEEPLMSSEEEEVGGQDDAYHPEDDEEEEDFQQEDEQLRMLREIMNEHKRKLLQGAGLDSDSESEQPRFYDAPEEDDEEEEECHEVRATITQREENKENTSGNALPEQE